MIIDYYEETACKCTNTYIFTLRRLWERIKYFMHSVPCLLGHMFTAQKNRCHTPNIPRQHAYAHALITCEVALPIDFGSSGKYSLLVVNSTKTKDNVTIEKFMGINFCALVKIMNFTKFCRIIFHGYTYRYDYKLCRSGSKWAG